MRLALALAAVATMGCNGVVPQHPRRGPTCTDELAEAQRLGANAAYGEALDHYRASLRLCRAERDIAALSVLPERLARLGEEFAPARTEVAAIRDGLQQHFDAHQIEALDLAFLARLNEALKDSRANERLFESATSEGRRTLWPYVAASWLDSRRYKMFVKYIQYAQLDFQSTVEARERVIGLQAQGLIPPGDEMTTEVIRAGAELVEAFLGAGDRARAEEALSKVLAVDPSPYAWSEIVKRVRRLGPELEAEYRARAISALGVEHEQELQELLAQ